MKHAALLLDTAMATARLLHVRLLALRVLSVALLAALMHSTASANDGTVVAIDVTKSTAQFRVPHIFVSNVTGTIPINSGSVILRGGSPIPLSVTAVLDAAKVHTDEPDRDRSLVSSDYFDTANFPTWTFTSTKIAATGPSAFTLQGDLIIHGVSQPEVLDVTVGGDVAHPMYHATGNIDRHAFGMKGARLDPVIGNPVEVTLDITLK